MYNIQVREAKRLFIKTGRLNKKVVNEEISKSWYKCYITHLDVKASLKTKQDSQNIVSNISDDLIKYISKLMDQNIDYFICNKNGEVVYKNIVHEKFKVINNIDEVLIGTNAAAISLRTEKYCKVSLEEHFLDALSDQYTLSLPIVLNEVFHGVCMMISDINFTEYELIKFQEGLKKIESKALVVENNSNKSSSFYPLNKLFTYPEPYFDQFREEIDKLLEPRLPILLMGQRGSGKTALALYLASHMSQSRTLIDSKAIPKYMRYDEVLYGLLHYETVIIENFEWLDSKTVALLTVYTEEKIITNSNDKYCDYNCCNLILTTVNTDFNTLKNLNINQRLMARIDKNYHILRNIDEFSDHYCKLVKSVVNNHGITCTDDYVEKLIRSNRISNFKEIAEDTQISELNNRNVSVYSTQHLTHIEDEKLVSLEMIEAQYIKKVLSKVDYNLTLAADILKISRSTLYRKLEKYQIETLSNK